MVAAKLANMPRGGAVYRTANLPTEGISQQQAADMLNVGERSVRSARKVHDAGAPEPHYARALPGFRRAYPILLQILQRSAFTGFGFRSRR